MGAWAPGEFADALASLAKAHGVSRSELIRTALKNEALASLPEDEEEEQRD